MTVIVFSPRSVEKGEWQSSVVELSSLPVWNHTTVLCFHAIWDASKLSAVSTWSIISDLCFSRGAARGEVRSQWDLMCHDAQDPRWTHHFYTSCLSNSFTHRPRWPEAASLLDVSCGKALVYPPCVSSNSLSERCRSPRAPVSCLWALCRCLDTS